MVQKYDKKLSKTIAFENYLKTKQAANTWFTACFHYLLMIPNHLSLHFLEVCILNVITIVG